MNKIFTARDAASRNRASKDARLASIERRELRQKIRRWQKKVAAFGGDMQRSVLAKFEARLAHLDGAS